MGGSSSTSTRAPRWRRRVAVAASLLIHTGLVCSLLRIHSVPRVPEESDAVEVLFEVAEPQETSTAPAASAGTVAAKSSIGHKRSDGAREAPAQVRTPDSHSATPSPLDQPAQGATAAAAAPTGAEGPSSGERSGWGTFQPLHPDLRGVRDPSPGEGNRRDLLAPPATRSTPSAPRDLPGVLRGGAGVTARVAEDGRIEFRDPKDISNIRISGLGIAGDFDATDQVMKLAGQTRYAAVKHKMAEETREARLCKARRLAGERQKQELFELSSQVRKIATRIDISAAERRKLVFEIWDECLEEPGGSDYGGMARATIVAIVREVFPEGSSLAYGPAELMAMNERRSSRQPFVPYRAELPKRPRAPDAGAEGGHL